MHFPDAVDPSKVGEYPGHVRSGGGYVWDEVLEYRVWCHPERGAPDEEDGDDYFCCFATYGEALAFAESTVGTEPPLALVLQREYIDEPEPGRYVHMREERLVEWSTAFLSRPRRTEMTIPRFFAADAPANRLDVLRGLA